MIVEVDLKVLAIGILAVLAMVLLIYLILLLRKIIGTLKNVDRLLTDTKVITEVASRRTTDVDNLLDGVMDAASGIIEAGKNNQGIVKAATNIAKAASSCVGVVKDKKATKEA